MLRARRSLVPTMPDLPFRDPKCMKGWEEDEKGKQILLRHPRAENVQRR
jgi:hypothetical protein